MGLAFSLLQFVIHPTRACASRKPLSLRRRCMRLQQPEIRLFQAEAKDQTPLLKSPAPRSRGEVVSVQLTLQSACHRRHLIKRGRQLIAGPIHTQMCTTHRWTYTHPNMYISTCTRRDGGVEYMLLILDLRCLSGLVLGESSRAVAPCRL